ncbi:MAG: hypothetical protein Q8N88_02655 [Nanoarchaeota archaeon]|nr:hypothetical protein [Nanoarchaeota archaeon]
MLVDEVEVQSAGIDGGITSLQWLATGLSAGPHNFNLEWKGE